MDNPNPIYYKDLITPDDSITKLIEQLDALIKSYDAARSKIQGAAQQAAQSMSNLSGATEEQRQSIASLSAESEKLAAHYAKYNKEEREAYRQKQSVIQATKEYSPVEFEISADDGDVIKKQLSIISVGNGKYIGGGMKAVPSAVPDDGLIDVVEVRAIKRWQLIFLLPLFVAGLHIKCGLGKTYRCRSLKLKSANMTYQLDGEVFSGESVEIKLVSGKLKASKATL